MDLIKLIPEETWTNKGQTTFNYILFLDSIYSFKNNTLNVNYQLLYIDPEREINQYVSGSAYLVPSEIVNEWSQDMEIYDYVIEQLGLQKANE